jgi:hypothetical protein
MEDRQRENLEHLQSLAEDDDFNPGELPDFPNVVNMADVLGGSERIELSHAGGELGSLEDGIEEDWVDEDTRTKYRFVAFCSTINELGLTLVEGRPTGGPTMTAPKSGTASS